MNEKLDVKRILIYLGFAFGIAWATGLAVYLTGGLSGSPNLIPNTPVTLALVLVAGPYMWAPALAHIFTRLVTREGWRDTYLRPHFKRGWPYWVAAWLLPAILTILGGALFFLIFPQYFDPSLSTLREMIAATEEQSGQSIPLSIPAIVAVQVTQSVLIAPLINSFFTFGEEFGWRAYLQPHLLPLGERTTYLLMGLIWGVWHWPVIAMGHNYGLYGLDYPGAPWSGMLAMVWFTLVLGTFLGWVTMRGGSVWPAVIGHAAVNGIAGLGVLFARGEPYLVLGPMSSGLIGSAGFTLAALLIFLWGAKKSEEQGQPLTSG
jgi:membrane protease YdiL (CAAX protease family)